MTSRPTLARLTGLALAAAALLTACGGDAQQGVSRMDELGAPPPPGAPFARTAPQGAPPFAPAGETVAADDDSTAADAPRAGLARGPMQGAPAGAPGTAAGAAPADGSPAPAPAGFVMPDAPAVDVRRDGQFLIAAGLAMTIPENWKQVEPSSRMRLAQFAIPGEGGEAEVTLFYFGPGQGGTAQANLERWVGQFEPPAGEESGATRSFEMGSLEQDNLRIALVRAEGTYNPGSMGMGGPAPSAQAGYALFGCVIEGGPRGNVFLKATGPAALMQAESDAFEAVAKSIRRME